MRPVPRQRLDLRLLAIEKRIQPVGDVHVSDGRRKGRRRIRFRVSSPGYGLPVEAVFEYTEWYAHTSQGWLLTKYVYEYRPAPPPSRLAHHLHEPLGAHRHCVDARTTGQPDHYEDYPVVLEQAHEEFAALAAQRRPISCAGLRPLKDLVSPSRRPGSLLEQEDRNAGVHPGGAREGTVGRHERRL